MELDDFKSAWASASRQPSPPDPAELLSLISKTSRGIRRSAWLDASIGIAVVVFFMVMVWIYGAAVQAFQYKLVAMAILYAIPIYVRIYRSINLLNHFDFGRDLKVALTEFRNYYKGTLNFYRWSTYAMLLTTVIIFLADESFRQLSGWIQAVIFGYIGLAGILTAPLVRRMYGKELRVIEEQLTE
ncbi:MAG TPA: hypothetical protein PLX35_16505 [Cyclobacteriaceae bacterium]|nr:hypothetical protein [Cyclobacteriaceae bacterium]